MLTTARHRHLLLLLLACPLLVSVPAAAEEKGAKEPLVRIQGELIDDQEKLTQALGLERGCADLSPKSRKRVTEYLEALGYRVLRLKCRGAQVVLDLRPWRVIRKIYIKGNWPLFEEEILRRLRFRPGQRLPEGEAFEQAKARQEERMKRYLSREGYFAGNLVIHSPRPTDVPTQVNLDVRVIKGKRYGVGEVIAEPAGRGGANDEKEPFAIPRAKIAEYFQHKIWFYKQSFNTKRFNEDVEELTKRFHALGYPGVRIKKSYEVVPGRSPNEAVRIRLRIQQRKQIKIIYQGNSSIDDEELGEALTLHQEGAYDDYELTQSANKIHKRYQSKGFLQARVSFARKVGKRRDEVTFKVHEGPRYRIQEVEFVGNKAIDSDELGSVVKTRPFPLLGWIGLGEGGYITDKQLKQDVERVEELYRERGFPDIKVSGEISPHRALLGRPAALAAAVGSGVALKGELFVRFTIDERAQKLVEKVLIRGNKLIGAPTLLNQLQLKPGRPFTAKALALDKARLVQIYGERGHPHAGVHSLEELSLDEKQVTVQFTVLENRPVRFGPIFIRGNFKTRESVIRGDLRFKPGDPFDIREIEKSERRLRARGIFNVVRMQLLGVSERRGEVPIVVSVEERYDDRGAIEVGVGGSTDNLLFGSLAYNNRNLLGFGTSISLKGEVGMKIQSGDLHYRDPRFFGSTVEFDTRGFVRNQITERLGEVLTFGGTVAFSYEIIPKLRGQVSYEIKRVKHKDELNRPAGVEEARQVDVFTQIAGIGGALVYDRRDNPLNPTEGYRLQGSVLWANPYMGGGQHFLKFNVSTQWFISLPKSMTIALAVRYDHAVPVGAIQLPKVERFYAGGDTTIRGLEQDMARIEVLETPLAPYAGGPLYQIRPQGGNIRLLTNVEFQFPIFKEMPVLTLPLMGAIFMDNGMITNSWSAFDVDEFRHGIGFAWRLVTPVGFFSVAFPTFLLDPGVGDDIWRVHFNFGFVF
jgi:outer membrane protein insertion porin family